MTDDSCVCQQMAILETRVLELHARVRFLSGSIEPIDVMDRHYYLDLMCKHLTEMVSLRRALGKRRCVKLPRRNACPGRSSARGAQGEEEELAECESCKRSRW